MDKMIMVSPSFPDSPILNEKYRPDKISDCILRESVKPLFENMVKDGVIKNMLLSGPAGSGKTTVAKALCRELDVEYIVINASSERSIDVLRTTVTSFATTASMNGKRRCVILDESDYLPDLTQAAFRNSIEEFSSNCSFIFTCNYPNRIIEPIKSRLTTVDFSTPEADFNQMVYEVSLRVEGILNNEGIEFNPDVLIRVVYMLFPDFRHILNTIDLYVKAHGEVDVGILEQLKECNIDTLVNYLKSGDFKSIRTWCSNEALNNTSGLYNNLYQSIFNVVEKDDIPKAIILLNDYQRFDNTVPDKELHLMALCTELYFQCSFKQQ